MGKLARKGSAPVRLGRGELVDDAGLVAASHGRQYFLDAVVAIDRRPLAELWRDASFAAAAEWPPFVRTPAGAEWARSYERDGGPPLYAVLNEWMERWRLYNTWCGWSALLTLWGWMEDLIVHKRPRDLRFKAWPLQCPPCDPTPHRPARLRFEATWDPYQETADANRARVLSEFAERLDRWHDETRRVERDQGGYPAPIKRSGEDHFRWLARWQVGLETYAEIARDAGDGRVVDADAVKDAIVSTARLITLERRPPDPPGRPPKILRTARKTGGTATRRL